jgi:acylglycerol lipase
MKHTENYFVNRNSYGLYCQSWQGTGAPKANVLIVHGLAEHSGRYAKMAGYLVDNGYAVFSYDQRGHGRSDGTRGYINRFSDFTADLDAYVRLLCRYESPARMFILGHSMGGHRCSSLCRKL